MTYKEAARIKVAMDIICELCKMSDECKGCPFEKVCDLYSRDGCPIPCNWEDEE